MRWGTCTISVICIAATEEYKPVQKAFWLFAIIQSTSGSADQGPDHSLTMSSPTPLGAAAGTGGHPLTVSESTSTILAAQFEDLSTDNVDDPAEHNAAGSANIFGTMEDINDNADDLLDIDALPLGASVSNTSVRILLSDFNPKRKRSDNCNNNADDTPATKRGKPNLPPQGEALYKAARNARAKAAKYDANESQLAKYLGHTEHIAPANIRLRATPAFGADESTMKSEWLSIIRQAEKALIAAEIEFLKRAQRAEETKARDALVKLQGILQRDPQAYNDAEAAIATVVSRVKASESQKLRQRWVHDIHRNEAAKVGLTIPRKPKLNGQTSKRPAKQSPTTQNRTFKQGKRRLQDGKFSQPNNGPKPGTSGQNNGNNEQALLKTLLTGLLNKM